MMSANRSIIQTDTLQEDKEKDLTIEADVKNDYTHYLQMSQSDGTILDTAPFDPTDRSVVGAVAGLKKSTDAKGAYNEFSELLINQVGSKKLMVIPDDCDLPNFDSPEKDKKSERMRHADREQLLKQTGTILQQYQSLTNELDKKFGFVADEESIVAGHDIKTRYQEITNIIEKARFTKDKMEEYKNEELQGKVSRFRNEYIRPMAFLQKNDKHPIAGLMRSVLMGHNFAYLSDEVMNQDLLPLNKFSGSTPQQQAENREIFLLAYLMHHACKTGLADQNHLFIIAADKREHIYEAVGFKRFPVNIPGWKVVSHFNAPGRVINNATDRVKQLPLPENPKVATENKSVMQQYGTYVVGGAALVGLSIFAYSLLKDKISVYDVVQKVKGPGMN